MRRTVTIAAMSITLLFVVAGIARAQIGYVNPFAGVLVVDDGGIEDLGLSVDASAMVGGVLGFALSPNWEVAAAYGFAPATAEEMEEGELLETDVDIHAYFAAANYIFSSESDVKFLLSGGLGGIVLDTAEAEVDPSHDFLLNFGAGVRWIANERFALQGVVRDHVQFCKAVDEDVDEVSACPLDDEALNHAEVSGGILILF